LLTIALGGFPFQIFTTFLERRFTGPTVRVSLHDLLRARCDLRGKERFVAMGARTIVDRYPSDFDQGFTDPVPVPGAGDHRNVSGCPSRPGHREVWPLGGLCDPLLGREPFPAFDPWASQRRRGSRWRRRVQGGIPVELTDQGQVAAVLTAKPRGLTGAIARVAHEDELTLREPADEATSGAATTRDGMKTRDLALDAERCARRW
jgi:antitoxin (DNA-binding transcriptional repressor) of toxin-antitoxin stability system